MLYFSFTKNIDKYLFYTYLDIKYVNKFIIQQIIFIFAAVL